MKVFQDLARDLYADPNKRIEFLELIKKTGQVENFIYEAKNIKGERFWINTSARIKDVQPDGTFLMDGFSLDITNQKMAEKILIEQERLSAIGEFTSSVAHDFNNTLQGILGNIELIEFEGLIPIECQENLTTIKILSLDAASRIKQLQRFAGKNITPSEYQILNMNQIIEDSIGQTRHLWRDQANKMGYSIKIETEFEDNVTFMGNAGELRNVLFNLIKNSTQAMPKGGIIRFNSFFKDSQVHLHISDTGEGMTEEVKTRIFQPFYTTKGFSQGKGLGLSGSYTIIKEHHGHISVIKSEVGKGTTVELRFDHHSPDYMNLDEKISIPHFPSLKLLWVEDESFIRNYVEKILTHFPFSADVIESGEKALKLFIQKDYDFIITDLGMPDMNGWQFGTEIRKINPLIPITVVTGWGFEISDETRMQNKVDYVLSKPVNLKQLIDLFQKISLKINKNKI